MNKGTRVDVVHATTYAVPYCDCHRQLEWGRWTMNVRILPKLRRGHHVHVVPHRLDNPVTCRFLFSKGLSWSELYINVPRSLLPATSTVWKRFRPGIGARKTTIAILNIPDNSTSTTLPHRHHEPDPEAVSTFVYSWGWECWEVYAWGVPPHIHRRYPGCIQQSG